MKKYEYEQEVRKNIIEYVNNNMNVSKYKTSDELSQGIWNGIWCEENHVIGTKRNPYIRHEDTAREWVKSNPVLEEMAPRYFYSMVDNDEELTYIEIDRLIRAYVFEEIVDDIAEEIFQEGKR